MIPVESSGIFGIQDSDCMGCKLIYSNDYPFAWDLRRAQVTLVEIDQNQNSHPVSSVRSAGPVLGAVCDNGGGIHFHPASHYEPSQP